MKEKINKKKKKKKKKQKIWDKSSIFLFIATILKVKLHNVNKPVNYGI